VQLQRAESVREGKCERGDLNPHDGSLRFLRSEGKTKNPANSVLSISSDDPGGHSGPCDRYRVPVLVRVPVGAQAGHGNQGIRRRHLDC